MTASARSDTRGRERTAVVSGAHGEVVSGGAVGAHHARLRGQEAAVRTSARGPNSAFKARVWRGAARARGSHAATAR
jgi:hypothetical protein